MIRSPASLESIPRLVVNTATVAAPAAEGDATSPPPPASCGPVTCVCLAEGSTVAGFAPDGSGGLGSMGSATSLAPCKPGTVVEPPPDPVPANSCDMALMPGSSSAPGGSPPASPTGPDVSPSAPVYCDELYCWCSLEGYAIFCASTLGGPPTTWVLECPEPGATVDIERLVATEGAGPACLPSSERPAPALEVPPTKQPRDDDAAQDGPSVPPCITSVC
jgi:hypothetical protein